MLRKIAIFLLVLLLLLAVGVASGCGCDGDDTSNGAEEEVTYDEEPTDDSEPPVTADPSSTVTMNGRSVMAGWMEHWGYDWEGPVEKDGYYLDYKELDADLSRIAGSFRENVQGLPEGSVTFFKFCFADFYGDNLSELEGLADEVIGIARENGLRLILGNALPMGEGDAPSAVVSEYEGYNSCLLDKSSDDSVWVYDFYGVLAGSDGYLKPEYDAGDSHLNSTAYRALDETFFPLLDSIYGR
ncbi:MAG: hypothetical protein KKF66_07840 [Actinobacteria bacterium]|nr:hypothetical protein [Actinomycetota bacterium]